MRLVDASVTAAQYFGDLQQNGETATISETPFVNSIVA
jgi:hypothetical protein